MVDTGDLKSPGGDPVTVRARSPVPKRGYPIRGILFLNIGRARTHLNATVRWTVARHRLDGDDTLISSSPFSGTTKQTSFIYQDKRGFSLHEYSSMVKLNKEVRVWLNFL